MIALSRSLFAALSLVLGLSSITACSHGTEDPGGSGAEAATAAPAANVTSGRYTGKSANGTAGDLTIGDDPSEFTMMVVLRLSSGSVSLSWDTIAAGPGDGSYLTTGDCSATIRPSGDVVDVAYEGACGLAGGSVRLTRVGN